MNNQRMWLVVSIALTAGAVALLMAGLGVGQAAYALPSAILTVTNAADSGPGTLRQAIADANTGDTIRFNLTYPAVIVLTTGSLTVTTDLTIDGPGPTNLTVSGNYARRVFYITGTVTISGVTVADGYASEGGGIINFGMFTLNNSAVMSNTASYVGGGILNIGALTVNDSIVLNNAAGYSGGIYNSGMLTLNNSTVMNNIAHDDYDNNTGTGGGIYNVGTLILSNSIIMSNTAYYSGGGIWNHDIWNDGSKLTLNNSTIMSNTAMFGGGIFNYQGTGILNNSIVMSNHGGGISNYQGTGILNNSIVMSNTAIFGGGIDNYQGLGTLNNSTIMSNTAAYGGGIDNYDGTLTVNNSTLSGNSATGSSGLDGGGAIEQRGGTSSLTINNSTIANNTAVSPNQARSGIWLETGVLTMTNSIVANNAITNNFAVEISGTLTSKGYNLSNNWNGLTIQGTDKTSDPLLAPLADNGGSTWTHALQAGSLAIDQIPNGVSSCGMAVTQDQRGQPRPSRMGGKCDIGAFELQGFVLTLSYTGNGSGSVTALPPGLAYPAGTLVTLTVTPLISSTFTGWGGAVGGTINPITVTMDADKIVTATFTLKPTAHAGPDQTTRTGRSVMLDGSASRDPGNFLPLTYQWQQTGGLAVALASANNVTTTFTAPAITQTNVLTFELTVTNTQGFASLPDVIVITVGLYRCLLPLILK
jgi:hypothetical protein